MRRERAARIGRHQNRKRIGAHEFQRKGPVFDSVELGNVQVSSNITAMRRARRPSPHYSADPTISLLRLLWQLWILSVHRLEYRGAATVQKSLCNRLSKINRVVALG